MQYLVTVFPEINAPFNKRPPLINAPGRLIQGTLCNMLGCMGNIIFMVYKDKTQYNDQNKAIFD